MAYKQPRVPPMKEGDKVVEYMRELILFLKDFSLETWTAVRTLQGADKDQSSKIVLRGEIEEMLKKQAEETSAAIEAAKKEAAESAQTVKQEAIDSALPVGIVISFATEDDPNALYPWQTWTQITDGRVQIAANDTYPLGTTGGEETHTLTESEMPSHKHTLSDGFWNYQESGEGYPGSLFKSTATPIQTTTRDVTKAAGGGAAHNNMQPYVARNVWQRTA